MIGVFGGTFDPIHYGHLRSAVEVKELFGLNEVRLIPSAQPPHRGQPSASAAQRLAMLRLAITGQTGLLADDREMVRGGKSYMIDTLQSLREDYPHLPILLFIGTDAFNHLTTWKNWQQLFDVAHVVVITRPGYSPQLLDPFFKGKHTPERCQLSENLAGKLYFQAITPLDISATAIRQQVAEHRNPAFLLPDTVIAYIRHHKLYQNH
ncbi:nicotinate-nucleotide adenylyltransferase [Methylosoma difficile]